MKPAHLGYGDRRQGLGGTDRSTESGEDYLACISELLEDKGYARVADVAEVLSVAEPSASAMIKRLAQKGCLNHEKYRGFTLTDTGHAMAREIHARRRTLTAFLQSLNLPENVIQNDVHGLEHHLSKETFEQLKRFVHTYKDRTSFEHSN
jgi:Mn-dependent DtxR family transcriptional regulator